MVDWKMSGFREEVNTKTAKICKQSFGQQGPPKLVAIRLNMIDCQYG